MTRVSRRGSVLSVVSINLLALVARGVQFKNEERLRARGVAERGSSAIAAGLPCACNAR
jgi:hypothetical protein